MDSQLSKAQRDKELKFEWDSTNNKNWMTTSINHDSDTVSNWNDQITALYANHISFPLNIFLINIFFLIPFSDGNVKPRFLIQFVMRTSAQKWKT